MGGDHEKNNQLGGLLEITKDPSELSHQGGMRHLALPPDFFHQWLGTEQVCDLCGTANASLQHILSSYKSALTQGRYRWRHDQILKKLAEVVESKRMEANREEAAERPDRILPILPL